MQGAAVLTSRSHHCGNPAPVLLLVQAWVSYSWNLAATPLLPALPPRGGSPCPSLLFAIAQAPVAPATTTQRLMRRVSERAPLFRLFRVQVSHSLSCCSVNRTFVVKVCCGSLHARLRLASSIYPSTNRSACMRSLPRLDQGWPYNPACALASPPHCLLAATRLFRSAGSDGFASDEDMEEDGADELLDSGGEEEELLEAPTAPGGWEDMRLSDPVPSCLDCRRKPHETLLYRQPAATHLLCRQRSVHSNAPPVLMCPRCPATLL